MQRDRRLCAAAASDDSVEGVEEADRRQAAELHVRRQHLVRRQKWKHNKQDDVSLEHIKATMQHSNHLLTVVEGSIELGAVLGFSNDRTHCSLSLAVTVASSLRSASLSPPRYTTRCTVVSKSGSP